MHRILSNFLVLEGLDGSGTTTQTSLLAERVASMGISVRAEAEPTDGPVGQLIRRYLHSSDDVDSDTFALLYAADRNEHLNGPNGIVSQATDRLVISDRYFLSSLAYQSVESGLDFVRALNDRFPWPELTLFVDLPVERCLERLSSRKALDRFETRERLDRVYSRYHEEVETYAKGGGRIEVVNGDAPEGEVFEALWSHITEMPIFKP